MKRLILLLVLVGVAYVAVNRERVFVRDPLATLTRDGVKEQGAQVLINFSNEALIENDRAPAYVTLVEQGRPIGTPASLKCIHYVVCLLDAYPATLSSVAPGAKVTAVSSKQVEFVDGQGRAAVVTLH